MIQLDAVSFYWPQSDAPTIQNISFTLEKGALLCVCGSNGAGKSTLFQVIAGLQQISSGKLCIEKLCCPGDESLLLQKTSLLLQDIDMQLLGTTVKENMLLPWSSPSVQHTQKAYSLATLFSIEKYWDSNITQLSHGQKQKLNIASALMLEPEILLFDEPYTGLDYAAISNLRRLLQQLGNQKLTRIISSHDIEPLIDIADIFLILFNGQQVFFGPPNDALSAIEIHPEWGIRLPYSWKINNTIIPWE